MLCLSRRKRKGTPSSLSFDAHAKAHMNDAIRRRAMNSPPKSPLRPRLLHSPPLPIASRLQFDRPFDEDEEAQPLFSNDQAAGAETRTHPSNSSSSSDSSDDESSVDGSTSRSPPRNAHVTIVDAVNVLNTPLRAPRFLPSAIADGGQICHTQQSTQSG